MENLLDTHTVIWFINGDNDLAEKAKEEIIKKPYNNFVSIVSFWEIAIKISIGKLELKGSFDTFVDKVKSNSFQILSVSSIDALAVATLPFHHRDPFDRMIIAQAQNNKLQIITRDDAFALYEVATLW
jgi:PIN domain nuclease of toxin-antitoxin system